MLSEDRAAELLASLSALIRTSRAVATRMHGASVTGTQIGALKHLADGELRMGDLADRLLVAPSVASRVVATLEHDGLVRRHPDPADARACLLALTDLGRTRLAERQHYSLQLIRDVLGDWTDEEAAATSAAMARLDARIPVFTERMLSEPVTSTPEPRTPAPRTHESRTREPHAVHEMERVS